MRHFLLSICIAVFAFPPGKILAIKQNTMASEEELPSSGSVWSRRNYFHFRLPELVISGFMGMGCGTWLWFWAIL
jgi:hypothetical protein